MFLAFFYAMLHHAMPHGCRSVVRSSLARHPRLRHRLRRGEGERHRGEKTKKRGFIKSEIAESIDSKSIEGFGNFRFDKQFVFREGKENSDIKPFALLTLLTIFHLLLSHLPPTSSHCVNLAQVTCPAHAVFRTTIVGNLRQIHAISSPCLCGEFLLSFFHVCFDTTSITTSTPSRRLRWPETTSCSPSARPAVI